MRQLAQLLGMMVAAQPAIFLHHYTSDTSRERARTRPSERACHTTQTQMEVNHDMEADLTWWIEEMGRYNGRPLQIRPDSGDQCIQSGMGCILSGSTNRRMTDPTGEIETHQLPGAACSFPSMQECSSENLGMVLREGDGNSCRTSPRQGECQSGLGVTTCAGLQRLDVRKSRPPFSR